MAITVRAVYEGGVLRPGQPLPLAEGETVDVTVAKALPVAPVLRPPTPEDEDYERRMAAATSLTELFAIMESGPTPADDDGYDFLRALNENRKATGERLLFPELEDGTNP